MSRPTRRDALPVSISVLTGLLVSLMVYTVGWAIDFLEESQERNEIRTFLAEMERNVFDEAALRRGVEGFEKAGAKPAPSSDTIRLTIFSRWLDDFELLISVDATHISREDRYKILRQVDGSQEVVQLLESSGRSWPIEGTYGNFFVDVRKQAKWLEQP